MHVTIIVCVAMVCVTFCYFIKHGIKITYAQELPKQVEFDAKLQEQLDEEYTKEQNKFVDSIKKTHELFLDDKED